MATKSKIPAYGNMPRPLSVEDGLQQLTAGLLPWDGSDIEITYQTDEFTCVCPTTGQPDYCTVTIIYAPDKKYIESKCMKFYLWSFREYGIHCEKLAAKIAQELFDATGCRTMRVQVDQKARGGLRLSAVRTLTRETRNA